DWVQGAWRKAGKEYNKSPRPKAELYLECLPTFTRGFVRLPDHARLIRELRLLERRTHRSGKDTVEHPRNGHDDHANVVCGLLNLLRPSREPEAIPIVQPIVAWGQPRGIPGQDHGVGAAARPLPSAPSAAVAYDYNTNQSWRDYVNADGSIRSTPRGRWAV